MSPERGIFFSLAWLPVVRHKYDYRIVFNPQTADMLHQVAQRLIHAFQHRGINSFEIRQTHLLVFIQKTAVFFPRGMDGIVGDIKIKRLFLIYRLFHLTGSLQSQCFSEINIFAMILFQPRNIPFSTSFSKSGPPAACPAILTSNPRFNGSSPGVPIAPQWAFPTCIVL